MFLTLSDRMEKCSSFPFSYTFSLHVPLSHTSWLLCVHISSRLKLLSYQLMIGCIYWSALDIKMTTWFCDPAAATSNNRTKRSRRKVTDEREDSARSWLTSKHLGEDPQYVYKMWLPCLSGCLAHVRTEKVNVPNWQDTRVFIGSTTPELEESEYTEQRQCIHL